MIPDYTRSSWYVRADTRRRLDELLPKVIACFDGAATATGAVEVEYVGHIYDELRSDPSSSSSSSATPPNQRSMLRGESCHLPVGLDRMGNVSRSSHDPPLLSVDYPTVNHQKEFADHTITPKGELAIHDGALAMAWTIVDLAEGGRWDELVKPPTQRSPTA